MNTGDLLKIAAIAGGVYLLYQLLTKGAQVLGTATAPVSNAIASAWVSLTSAPAINVSGSILFPDGSTVPVAGQTLKTDSSGNVYVMQGGMLYQLGQSDANGNWPASAVLEPNFGVTGTSW